MSKQVVGSDWPVADTETLGCCPVCASAVRESLYTGLRDTVFYCAPGSWNLWRCGNCEIVYLDPRPTQAAIGRAYEAYYTHQSTAHSRFSNVRESGIKALEQRFRNGELNRRFGYTREPALRPRWLSSLFAGVLRDEAVRLGRHIRQLPPPLGPASQLLDVGAGNGDFLVVADTLGFRARGLEFDAQAVAVGTARGLRIALGAIPGTSLEANTYEHVTLNHVIEHLHDPVAALRELHTALVPGGRIWVQTPNLDACGHVEFGIHWRGLEPPRHLVLFNAETLRQALSDAGFRDIELLPPAPEAKSYYRRSLAMVHGLRPESDANPYWNRTWKRRAQRADRSARKNPERGESITLVGRR